MIGLMAIALSAALTRGYVALVGESAVVAVATERSMHKGHVPTGAGLPLLLAVVIALWLVVAGPPPGRIVMAALALAAVSFADDIAGLPPLARFPVHIACAAVAVLAVPQGEFILGGLLPHGADRLLAGLALVWFMNLYNFMDGIDGIAGLESIAVALGLVVVRINAGLPGEWLGGGALDDLALALAAGSAGFLVWNWRPAKVFLGDVGAVPIGFLLGAMLIDLAARGHVVPALILPSAFVVDATATLFARLRDRERPWAAHRRHAYQRAARGTAGHAGVSLRFGLANVGLIGASLLAIAHPLMGLAVAVAVLAMLFAELERLARLAPP